MLTVNFDLSHFTDDSLFFSIRDSNNSYQRAVFYKTDPFIDILKYLNKNEEADRLCISMKDLRECVKYDPSLSPRSIDIFKGWTVSLDIPKDYANAEHYLNQIQCQMSLQASKIDETAQKTISFTSFRDEKKVRYTLLTSNPHPSTINWLFFPGGPGADSKYTYPLVKHLQLPGNTWGIDFFGNGDNIEGLEENYDYNEWKELFPDIVNKFAGDVVYVTHSYSGQEVLNYPILESKLKGVVILNSVPSFTFEKLEEYGKLHGLPNASRALQEIVDNPSLENLMESMKACMSYYFAKEKIAEGAAILSQYPFAVPPLMWRTQELKQKGYNATWIPQEVPTIIIGCEHDHMCPHKEFESDPRFNNRENIEMFYLKGIGHMGWLENSKPFEAPFNSLIAKMA